MARVFFSLGDIFDEPGEVVVIPADIFGGTSQAFTTALEQFRIDRRVKAGKLGLLSDSFNAAFGKGVNTILMFAYSVDPRLERTPLEALESIGQRIGQFCKQRGFKTVSCPLLGTGAGNVEPYESFRALRAGFYKTAAETELKIVVKEEGFFTILQREAFLPRQLSGLSRTDHDETFLQHGMNLKGLIGYIMTRDNAKSEIESLELRAYHLFNPEDFFYTTNEGDENFRGRESQQLESPGYVIVQDGFDLIRLHRFVHEQNADHIFVTEPELDVLHNLGYREETRQRLYIWSSPLEGTAPLYLYSTIEAAVSFIRTNASATGDEGAERKERFYSHPKPEGYHETTEDQLQFQNDIDSFANVVTRRAVTPPLAIGLFGNWGSGKSFFMSKLQKQIKNITKQEESNPEFVNEVVHVNFNSWHYSDANLWASLITQIFESLKIYTEKDQEKSRALEDLIKTLEITNAQREVQEFQAKELEVKVGALETEREKKRVNLEHLSGLKVLKTIINNGHVQEDFKSLVNRDLEKVIIDTDKLNDLVEEGNRLQIKYSNFFGNIVRLGKRWWYMVLPIAAGVTLVTYCISKFWLKEWNWSWGVASAALTTVVTATQQFFKFIQPVRKRLDMFIARVESIQQDINALPIAISEEERNATERLQSIRDSLQEIDKKIVTATATINDIRSGKPLYDFIEKQSRDENYARQLGLISWIRKDFVQLDKLLRDQKVAQSAGTTVADSKPLRIDRIILYIDDLDRCKEETVVKVLEAIHLLLAFELFVVIVGVDPRWLNNALSDKYKNLFGTEGAKPKKAAAGEQQSATTYDYLEKIFQVTFSIKPINKTGRERLIDYLLKSEIEIPTTDQLNSAPEEKQTQSDLKTPVTEGQDIVLTINEQQNVSEITTPKIIKPVPLTFTSAELTFMKIVSAMFGHTPRTINRYVNVYRIIKSHKSLRVSANTDQDYSAVMFVLAIVIGYAEQANTFIGKLNGYAGESVTGLLSEVKFGKHQIPQNIRDAVADIPVAAFRRNLELISRFSFRTYSGELNGS